MFKRLLLSVLGASLVVPAAASAQTYYAQAYYGQRYPGQGYYGQDYGGRDARGDYYGAYRGFSGYPEFRGLEDHIRREIREGVRDDLIEPEDARDLFHQLRDIQGQEAREFRVHGWRLPDDDRYRLRARLDQLDRLVDQIKEEPEG